MLKPNFFILGAPKCGTTSMAEWLSNHPQIFMSKIKEPHYYNEDHKNRAVINYKHYLSLFKKADNAHKIIGEASVWYLYSKEAVINIKKDLKNANVKFLVMVRNPVEMAYSLHQQQVFNLNEPVKNFKEAWNLESERKQGKRISSLTQNAGQLLYGDICKLGQQLERLYSTVDNKFVKTILLDDMKENPGKQYRDVLSFLDLSFDERKDFKPVNESKSRKSEIIAGTIKVLGKIKHELKITKGFGILNKAQTINTVPKKREKLDVEFEHGLKDYFREDILLLSSILNRDLSHWLK